MAHPQKYGSSIKSTSLSAAPTFEGAHTAVPPIFRTATPSSNGRAATTASTCSSTSNCTSIAQRPCLIAEDRCWKCHFEGPFGNTTDRASVSSLLALLGVLGFCGGATAVLCSCCVERGCCGCARASSDYCPAQVDCDSNATFACSVTTTHPDCFVLQREAAQEGMCTCYDACSTPPYSEVLPIDFTVGRGPNESHLYCEAQPSSFTATLFALGSLAFLTLVFAILIGCCEPKWANCMSKVSWLMPVLMVYCLVTVATDAAKSIAACNNGYQDQVVGPAFPRDMQCNNKESTLAVIGSAVGVMCSCYLPVLLHMRKLAVKRFEAGERVFTATVLGGQGEHQAGAYAQIQG